MAGMVSRSVTFSKNHARLTTRFDVSVSAESTSRSFHNLRNSSTASKLSLNLYKVLNKATTSARWSKFAFVCGLRGALDFWLDS